MMVSNLKFFRFSGGDIYFCQEIRGQEWKLRSIHIGAPDARAYIVGAGAKARILDFLIDDSNIGRDFPAGELERIGRVSDVRTPIGAMVADFGESEYFYFVRTGRDPTRYGVFRSRSLPVDYEQTLIERDRENGFEVEVR